MMAEMPGSGSLRPGRPGAGRVPAGGPLSSEMAMTCKYAVFLGGGPGWIRRLGELALPPGPIGHALNSDEPSACAERIRIAGRFVRADVLVIGCIRFRTVTSWRTMEREASTKGTAALGVSSAETCGGVMVRGPASGNGESSGVYYPAPADLAPPRPQARALYDDQVRYGDRDGYSETASYGEMDPFLASLQADGTIAAGPGFRQGQAFGRGRRGAGGRWLLWPLRVVLWAALLVV